MAKFKTDTPVVHVKSGVRGTVIAHEGDKVTYLKDDGSTSTVNATSLQTVSKYEAEQAKAAKKAEKEKAAKERQKTPRVRKAGNKDGYVQSGQLEYDPNRYSLRDGVATPSGNKVKDVNDDAAVMLAGLEFDAMLKVVAKETGRQRNELAEKYEHLNPGMQRMTLGNILRGALREKAEGVEPAAKKKAPAKKALAKKVTAKKAAKPKDEDTGAEAHSA